MDNFEYQGERFADIQMLRYRLPGFEKLSLRQKTYIYYLSEATLWGRDITFDQFGKYNLVIRKTLEIVYQFVNEAQASGFSHLLSEKEKEEYAALEEYLKRVWFSNGIYHHYATDKFKPAFSQSFFCDMVRKAFEKEGREDADDILKRITPIMFDDSVLPKRVNKTDGVDIIKTSACNYYDNVSQEEVENYYASMCDKEDKEPPSYGLNSTLVKDKDGNMIEEVWRIGGKYSEAIKHIVENLNKAKGYAENDLQKKIITLLVDYYTTGDLRIFDNYSIEWIKETEGMVDFINGFIEVYGDPLGIKASWEGVVEYKDLEACERTQKICGNAQWFEDNSPVDKRFKKPVVKGVTANVICAAMLGGDEYPSTAIGINLPNADWIRAQYGSKSVTISNLTEAYSEASKGSGFLEEFAIDEETIAMIRKYGHLCDDLHTDLHECLGHGSGQILEGVDPNALKNYSSTIEEARADLFGLYYIADEKMVELGLLPDMEAYKSQYYTYLMNGLLTQNVRITLGYDIEEAHMRNRALIANWCLENAEGAIELVSRDGKSYLKVNDYRKVRSLFGILLAEIQRQKSEGDYDSARSMVEKYGVNIDRKLHEEVLERYSGLGIAPYKGFLNPVLSPKYDYNGEIADVEIDYTESLSSQMQRYSKDYSCFVL